MKTTPLHSCAFAATALLIFLELDPCPIPRYLHVAVSWNFLTALDNITTVLAQQRRHKLHP